MAAMKLLDLYKAILSTAWVRATEDAYLKTFIPGEEEDSNATPGIPATIKGKSLVLPTEEHLRNPNWENRVVFHPLSENVMRGESDVLAWFRQQANMRINYVSSILAVFLLRKATSVDEHGKLNPDQSEYLSKVKQADKNTVEALKKLLDQPANEPQKSFVQLYLKRKGQVGGTQYKRVGVVSFPLYNELKKFENGHVFGVKLRKKDQEALLALLEYMFPNIGQPDAYNRGSNSDVAPSLDALMKAIAAVADPINGLVELFRNLLGEKHAEDMWFDDGWVETFENLAVMQPQIRSLPMSLAGNEGSVKAEGAPPAAPQAMPGTVGQPAPATVGQPAPATVGLAAPVQPQQAPQQSQQVWTAPQQFPQQPQQQQNFFQQPGFQQPGQFQQQAAPATTTTDGKLNFDAFMQTHPQFAQQVGFQASQFAPAYAPMQQQMQPMQRQPRWANRGFQQPGFGQAQPLAGGQGVMYPQQPWQPGAPGFNQGGGSGGRF